MLARILDKNINYQIKGYGKPLILIHGWGGTSKSLEKLSLLLSNNYQTITLDLPGFGKSDDPPPHWGVEEYSEFLIQFLEKLKLNKIIYFGHSFGGSLGIFLAAKHPKLIDKLILCNSSFKREVKISKSAMMLKNIAKFFPFLFTFEASIKRVFYRLFLSRSDLYRFPHLQSNLRKIVLQDLTINLAQINIKTLILWGEDDTVTKLKLAHELNNKIKNSKLKIFPKIGHNLPLKFPQKVYEEIEKFL